MIGVFWDIWVGLCSWSLMRYSRPQADLGLRRTRLPFCLRHAYGLIGEIGAYQSVNWHTLLVCLSPTSGAFVATWGSLVRWSIVKRSYIIDYLSCVKATYGF